MTDGARLYVGTYDGMQVLHVRGDQYELIAEAFQGEIVQAVGGCLERPERLFVGLCDGVHRTDDGGMRWRKVLDGDVRSITVDPTDDRVIYAGTDPVHLVRSEDSGDTWEELVSLQRLPEQTHARLGEAEPVSMEGSHDPSFRHRRQDWWFPVPPHKGHVLHTFVHPDDPNLLLLAIEHGGVARSTDRGQTWEDVSEGVDYLDMHRVMALPHRFDRYFVTSARGLYTTDDPAHGWMRAQNDCDRDYFHDMLFLPPANGGDPVMVVATAIGSPGYWPSFQDRHTWDRSQTGSRAALFRSTDCGQSWQRIGAGSGLPEEMDPMIWTLCRHPSDKNGLFAGLGESTSVPSRTHKIGSGSVLTSLDGGESWTTIGSAMQAVEHLFAAPD